MLNRRIVCPMVLGLGLALPAMADDIVTDRPDATESSAVIQPGFAQAEMGWVVSDGGTSENHELPQMLLRIGLVEKVELRLGWSGYLESGSAGDADGALDGDIGVKVYLAEEDGVLPELALLTSISLPWGDDALTSDEVDPAFRFAFAHTLSDRFSLGYNLGAEWGTEGGSTLSSFIYTVALGVGLTDKIGCYLESFGESGLSADGEAHSVDGGFTYLVRDNFQLDILAGVGLSNQADDWFAGAGFSYRFPE